MDLIEKKFRETKKTHSKYAERLTEHINDLISKEKVLEAEYHFKELLKLKGNNNITIRIGYILAIKTFNTDCAKYFHSQLFASGASHLEMCTFLLKYYYSQNNKEQVIAYTRELLSNKLNSDQLLLTFEICDAYQDYNMASGLVKYFAKNKLKFNPTGTKRIKKILLTELATLINKKAKNA